MIKIVTDSVASIPDDMLIGKQVEIVSLYLHREDTEYVDSEIDIDTFYADIYTMVDSLPTSSQPSQQRLEKVFESIARAGDELLGIFVSSGLSGTLDGVLRAAKSIKAKLPSFNYAIIDSMSCGFDEAWPVFEALNAAEKGKSLSECVEATTRAIRSTRFLFTPETLTFLQKGGRIGNAAALLGNLIQLSPVLTVIEGKAATVAKIRSRKKALDRIVRDFKNDIDTYGLKNIVVHYIGDKKPALEWASTVIEPLLQRTVRTVPVSPVIGMHVGPAVGIAYECLREMPYKFPTTTPHLVYTA